MVASKFTIFRQAFCFGLLSISAFAQMGGLGRPEILRNVGIEQRLNSQLPFDAAFLDDTGKSVHLGDYFAGGKPVVLAFVYYQCPMLCNLELDGLFSSLKKISLNPGADYEVVAISFDARENPTLAAAKKATYLKSFGRPASANGIHFLSGKEHDIQLATEAAGFHYNWDSRQQQFAHASGIMIATPQGRLARYFYGIHYIERDVRLGLVEASDDKIGSPADEILLFCYHYDPTTGKYGLFIVNLLRVTGISTFVGLMSWIIIMLRRDKSGKNPPGATDPRGQWRSV
jgi:protein SCO1/2